MRPIRIKTRLESDTITLPELRQFVGKNVEIRVSEDESSAIERMLDTEYHSECEADTTPDVTLEEVRAALSPIPGSMTEDISAEREER